VSTRTTSIPSRTPVRTGVERDCRRISAVPVGADRPDAHPCSPGLQLVGCRRTERVGRAEDDRAAVSNQHTGQLADRRRLARAIHADDEQPPRGRGRHRAGRSARCPATGRDRGPRGREAPPEQRPDRLGLAHAQDRTRVRRTPMSSADGPAPTSASSNVSSSSSSRRRSGGPGTRRPTAASRAVSPSGRAARAAGRAGRRSVPEPRAPGWRASDGWRGCGLSVATATVAQCPQRPTAPPCPLPS